MTGECADEFTCRSRPDFDCSVTRGRDNVFLIEVNNIYSGSVAKQAFTHDNF